MTNEQLPTDRKPSRYASLDKLSSWYEHRIEEIVQEDLNSFCLWVPYALQIGILNEHATNMDDKPRALDSFGLHTRMWAAQSTREFIQTISDAVDTIPGLRERLKELHEQGADAEAVSQELPELYKILRREGYSHYDLVA